MHFMGLSLGAHTAAYTARTLPRIARLTGLDPAGPLYEGNSDEVKLNVNDAAFVEVIHTNGFPLTSFGSYSPLGDVDFYFNGGVIQPGCGFGRDINIDEKLVTQNISIVNGLLQPARCSHSRSLVYYTEALKNQGCIFWGSNRRTSTLQSTPTTHETRNSNLSSLKECTLASCIPVGLKTIDYPAKGSFDVYTRSSSPFCIKHTDVDQHMMQELEEFQSQQLETIKF
ncbi:phospholipase A1-like [Periplaneta americana]|uniref:phospholipase A1-like n=1 Tax=Periplaneta americana TaxID=6978 RepID=UPI0037E81C27